MFFLSLRRLRLNKKGYVPRSKQLVNLESNVDLSYSKDVTVIYVIIASFSIVKKKGQNSYPQRNTKTKLGENIS